jgi:hypothetical protein
VGWNGAGCGTGATCTITVAHSITVGAVFSRTPYYALAVTTSGTGSGTVTTGKPYDQPPRISCPGTCSYSFASGSLVDLVATPTSGSKCVGWTGDCSGTGGCTVTMDETHNVNAEFASPMVGNGSLARDCPNSDPSCADLTATVTFNVGFRAFSIQLPSGYTVGGAGTLTYTDGTQVGSCNITGSAGTQTALPCGTDGDQTISAGTQVVAHFCTADTTGASATVPDGAGAYLYDRYGHGPFTLTGPWTSPGLRDTRCCR